MKILSGSELAEYIKNNQARQVRALRQSKKIIPRLAIIQTGNNSASNSYIKMKKAYGDDILVEIDHYKLKQSEATAKIEQLNKDEAVHGIIVQLPLEDCSATDEILKLVAPSKDVDGLGSDEFFTPATPLAIEWLLAGYNINLLNKQIVIVGRGRLVGRPLERLWEKSGLNVQSVDEDTPDIEAVIAQADIIVTAVGEPGIIKADYVKNGAVLIDAGVALDKGVLKGDVDAKVRSREDVAITPEKGGVGPLTITALFGNVILAAQNRS